MMTKDGSLVKLSQGLYYAPKTSKFGVVPPEDDILVESFLKVNDFLLVRPNAYNSLGLGLTQLYNTTWVYNHKRKGEFKLCGKTFEFKLKSAFPRQITKEYLLVDLLNNLDELVDDQHQILKNVSNKIDYFNEKELKKAIQQYGSGITKQLLKTLIRNKRRYA
jgi:hypothetical protein